MEASFMIFKLILIFLLFVQFLNTQGIYPNEFIVEHRAVSISSSGWLLGLEVGKPEIKYNGVKKIVEFSRYRGYSLKTIFQWLESDTVYVPEGMVNIRVEIGFGATSLDKMLPFDSIIVVEYDVYDVDRKESVYTSFIALVGRYESIVYDSLNGGYIKFYNVSFLGTRIDSFMHRGGRIITRARTSLGFITDTSKVKWGIPGIGYGYRDSSEYFQYHPFLKNYLPKMLSFLPTSVERTNEIAKDFNLYQNYPNPFNPSTTIEFDIPERSNVKLIVYDILGREIETLIDKELEPGKYKLNFNATNLPSGVYFYTLKTPKFTKTNKMLLIK
jgi:hypothetical protein